MSTAAPTTPEPPQQAQPAADQPAPAPDAGAGGVDLAARLAGVRVGVRNELDVTRHVFRGEVNYVLRDPITFKSHAMGPRDYRALTRIGPQHTLGQVFAQLVDEGTLEPDQQDEYYQFILTLHRLGFLMLPISDDKALYKRYEQVRAAKRKGLWKRVLFYQMPLCNPDAFLNRTVGKFAWLFSKPVAILWAVMLAVSLAVVFQRWGDLTGLLPTLLGIESIILSWLILVGLKVIHEFGHAYACKHYGGHVPEMGAYFIMFTPCAFMDASACWGFTERRDRLMVCLGGMYFESFCAMAALFVWATAPPGFVQGMAYQVFILASLVTLIFNANPLMRFDGYFILSDTLEIPNLRSRSTAYAQSLFNQAVLGVQTADAPNGLGMKVFFVVFAIACAIYRVFIVLGICSLIAAKLFVVGMGLALFYIFSELSQVVTKTCKFLWIDPRTADVRYRAIATSVLLLALIPLLVIVTPSPGRVQAAGVVKAEHEHHVAWRTQGVLTERLVEPGRWVRQGEPLARLQDPQLEAQAAAAVSRVAARQAAADLALTQDPAAAAAARRELAFALREAALLEDQLERQTAVAPAHGRVVAIVDDRTLGHFAKPGEPVATVADGRWRIKAYVNEQVMSRAAVGIGDTVRCRLESDALRTITGTVIDVAPVGIREVTEQALLNHAGGPVAVMPGTGQTQQAWYAIDIEVVDTGEAHDTKLAYGMRVQVLLPGKATTVGQRLAQSILRFRDRLLIGG
ncbi:MAG: HlyD family efflux transporter periplasmic adaptor subunit [Planctomycetota bacterium]